MEVGKGKETAEPWVLGQESLIMLPEVNTLCLQQLSSDPAPTALCVALPHIALHSDDWSADMQEMME